MLYKLKHLVNALDRLKHKSPIKQKIADKKTYNITMNQQLNWLQLVLHGKQKQGCSTGEVC